MLSGNEILSLPPRPPRSLIPLKQLTQLWSCLCYFAGLFLWGRESSFHGDDRTVQCGVFHPLGAPVTGVGQKTTLAPHLLLVSICVGFITWGANEDACVLVAGLEVGLNINAFVILIDLKLQILIYYSFWSSAQKSNLVKCWLYISIPKVTQFLDHGGKHCRNF